MNFQPPQSSSFLAEAIEEFAQGFGKLCIFIICLICCWVWHSLGELLPMGIKRAGLLNALPLAARQDTEGP